MKPSLLRLFALPRSTKQIVLMVSDFVCLPALFWAALALRYDTARPDILDGATYGLALIATLSVVVLRWRGVYRAVVRAFDEKFLSDLLGAVVTIVGVLFVSAGLGMLSMPRSVPFIYGFFIFLWVWASRSTIRRLVRLAVQINAPPLKRVAIYGAGAAGRQLLAVLNASADYFPVAFFDDGRGLAGTTIYGMRVFAGRDFASLHKSLQLDEVLIALPSVSRTRLRQIIERLEPHSVRVRSLPGLDRLVGGKVSISDIREVEIGDLLGRDTVPPKAELLRKDIAGKRVLVTGAGGSIGSELCRQVLKQEPELLVLWELSEFALYSIEQELSALNTRTRIVSILGSVLHQARMTKLMSEYEVDTVYHAAAYKHVPIVEENPFEGFMNNTVGTFCAARASIDAGVSTFVLISTDKAVRPTNVMGATKRLAEMTLQALHGEASGNTRFVIVRFGNVLGSSGSVVPLFREQIARGGPVTVTHPDVTRFFMTIPEAAQLVLQAGAMGLGGDVFVLDMGESVKIVSLAKQMIRLSGMTLRESGEGDIEIVFSGLRPGEKLYEELLIGSNVTATAHERIMRAMEGSLPLAELELLLSSLQQHAENFDVPRFKRELAKVIEGYPSASVPPESLESDTQPRIPANVIALKMGA